MEMADGVGFEPTRPLRAYGISSAAPSTKLGDPSFENCAERGYQVALLGRHALRQAMQLSSAWSTVRPVLRRFCRT